MMRSALNANKSEMGGPHYSRHKGEPRPSLLLFGEFGLGDENSMEPSGHPRRQLHGGDRLRTHCLGVENTQLCVENGATRPVCGVDLQFKHPSG